jgi:hypothetical protein
MQNTILRNVSQDAFYGIHSYHTRGRKIVRRRFAPREPQIPPDAKHTTLL